MSLIRKKVQEFEHINGEYSMPEVIKKSIMEQNKAASSNSAGTPTNDGETPKSATTSTSATPATSAAPSPAPTQVSESTDKDIKEGEEINKDGINKEMVSVMGNIIRRYLHYLVNSHSIRCVKPRNTINNLMIVFNLHKILKCVS